MTKRIITDKERLEIGKYYVALTKDKAIKTAKKFKIGLSTARKLGSEQIRASGLKLPREVKATEAQKIEAVKRVKAGESINKVQKDYPISSPALKILVEETKKYEVKAAKQAIKKARSSSPFAKSSLKENAHEKEISSLRHTIVLMQENTDRLNKLISDLIGSIL